MTPANLSFVNINIRNARGEYTIVHTKATSSAINEIRLSKVEGLINGMTSKQDFTIYN